MDIWLTPAPYMYTWFMDAPLAKKVVNCGGNYSDELDLLLPRTIDESKPFVIRPGTLKT